MTVQQVTDIYINQNKNVVETAKELGVSTTVLRMFLNHNKITKNPGVLFKKEQAQRNADIWKSFHSQNTSD